MPKKTTPIAPDRCTLLVTVGLPYSGKSTALRGLNAVLRGSGTPGAPITLTNKGRHQLEPFPIVSPDAIRAALHGHRFLANVEPLVWQTARTMVDSLFLTGHNVVALDACNVDHFRRKEWLQPEKWRTIFVVCDTAPVVCIDRARDANDEHIVAHISRMYRRWSPPLPSEEMIVASTREGRTSLLYSSIYTGKKLLIVDKDDTVTYCTVEGQPCPNNVGEQGVYPRAVRALQAAADAGCGLGMASNQGGIPAGFLTAEIFGDIAEEMTVQLRQQGLILKDGAMIRIAFSPHMKPHCSRKPAPGMLLGLMRQFGVEPRDVLFVGDRPSDRDAAQRAGVEFMLASDWRDIHATYPLATAAGWEMPPPPVSGMRPYVKTTPRQTPPFTLFWATDSQAAIGAHLPGMETIPYPFPLEADVKLHDFIAAGFNLEPVQ